MTKYYGISGPSPTANPAQWNGSTTAVRESLFRPLDPVLNYDGSETYSMALADRPDLERQSTSVWSMCMGLLSQGMLSLPVFTLPKGVDFYDLDAVAAMVRNITRQAAPSSPFLWHKARRHAPTPSGACAKGFVQTYGYSSRMHIGPIAFEAPNGTVIRVRGDEDLSLPFHGFSWGMLGYGNCACGAPVDTQTCRLNSDVCAAAVQNKTPACLIPFCGRTYSAVGAEAQAVWACLHASSIRCPELGPSDSWGLFPTDCTDEECRSTQDWVGNAQMDTVFEGIRFATEGRSGLRLPNYRHVNASFHEAIHHGAQQRPVTDYQVSGCVNVDSFLESLFPALQLMFDSPVVSHCSRFVIETARVQILSMFPSSSLNDRQEASRQASLWKSKCSAKIRHLSSCSGLGLYYDVQPPDYWPQILPLHCDVPLHAQWDYSAAYITPWSLLFKLFLFFCECKLTSGSDRCVAVHQGRRQMYNARLCQRRLLTQAERELGVAQSKHPLNTSDLVPECLLPVQPLSLLAFSSPLSNIFTVGAKRLNTILAAELSTAWDLPTIASALDAEEDHISHIYDWWPSDVSMPVGYHVTAPMLEEELAPVGFDSHYAYDANDASIHYVHSGLRNASLVGEYLGAGGLCRYVFEPC